MSYPVAQGQGGHATSHYNVVRLQPNTTQKRAPLFREVYSYALAKAARRPLLCDQPQVSGPYAFAWMFPVTTFATLFVLAWMVGR
jgi:hypothetical protein